MCKKRSVSPFYSKPMQRVMAAAVRSGDVPMILEVTSAVKQALRKRAFRHLLRHAFPAPLTGVNYGAISTPLGLMARFS